MGVSFGIKLMKRNMATKAVLSRSSSSNATVDSAKRKELSDS